MNNIGLGPGTMGLRPLNVSPPGKKPEREPFKVFQEGVDHMIGRFLRGVDARTVPASRRALEIIRTLEKKSPQVFARFRALPDFPSAPVAEEPIPPTVPPPARETPPELSVPKPLTLPAFRR